MSKKTKYPRSQNRVSESCPSCRIRYCQECDAINPAMRLKCGKCGSNNLGDSIRSDDTFVYKTLREIRYHKCRVCGWTWSTTR